MQSKKTQLLDLIVMFPEDPNFYSSDKGNLINSSKKYPDFRNFVLKRSGKKLLKKDKDYKYVKLAIEKGYIVFSKEIKDALFYLPKGVILYDIIHAYIMIQMQKEGFTRLGLPYFFKRGKKDINELVDKFGRRLMGISTSKDIFLRYASDPVLFSFLRNAEIPEKYDPLKIYSSGDIFRSEKMGEINRLKRPRISFIEDYHIFTSNALKEIRHVHAINSRVMDEICGEWFISCDIEESFFKKQKKYLREMAEICKKPILFNIYKTSPNYYTLQFQYFYGISDGTFINYADLQLDNINGKRFNIQIKDRGFVDIIHGNTTGRMEKLFIVLFDRAIKIEKENKKPMLPIWVSPVQVRIIPTDNVFVDYCNNISEQFIKFGFRVDIDDTELKFNKKIRNAEKEWIPYVIVIGEKEIKSGNISLRIRNGNQIVTTITRFIKELESRLKEYPKIPQHLPVFVSKQLNINSL